MSRCSSKYTETEESPNRDIERISEIPGRPRIETSTGKVMSFSTSTAPSPGASVTIWTTVGVTSGEASIGSAFIARMPIAQNTMTRIMVIRRFSNAASKIRRDISTRRSIGQQSFQNQPAAADDAVALAQARHYLDKASRRDSQLDAPRRVFSVAD